MPTSSLANHFVSRIPGPQTGSLEYVTRKEAFITRFSKRNADIRYSPLPSVRDHRCASVATVDCSARRSDNRSRICLHVFLTGKLIPDVFDVFAIHA